MKGTIDQQRNAENILKHIGQHVIKKSFHEKRSKNTSAIMKDKKEKANMLHNWFSTKFRTIDLFGQTVNLTWNGEEKFKTTFGASVTIFMLSVLIVFSVVNLLDVLNRTNPTISKTSLLRTKE